MFNVSMRHMCVSRKEAGISIWMNNFIIHDAFSYTYMYACTIQVYTDRVVCLQNLGAGC